MAPTPPPRRPEPEGRAARPSMLPDRTREVSASPELDGAVSSLLDLARWAKARRHRGRLTDHEARTVELALQRRTGAFGSALRRMLHAPAGTRPATGSSASTTAPGGPGPARSDLARSDLARRTVTDAAQEPDRDEGTARG